MLYLKNTCVIFLLRYMDNKQILGALALDLKRVALGLHRKSFGMADKFLSEAMKRKEEVDTTLLAPYMCTILDQVSVLRTEKDTEQTAENALMYSTRIQNYVLYK